MEALYAAHRDRAAFFVVYVAEAHATDGWQVAPNVQEGVLLREHGSIEDRRAAARQCTADLGITVPTLVDGMDDATCAAYSAWPDRIYVIDVEGRVAYKGAPGPWGFRAGEAGGTLERVLTPGDGHDAAAGSRGNGRAGGHGGGRTGDGLRAFRGPGFFYATNRQAPSEADHVVEAWQLEGGRVYLRTRSGEQRVVEGYIGGIGLVEGQLVLIDDPQTSGMPPLRQQAHGFKAAVDGELQDSSNGDACPVA